MTTVYKYAGSGNWTVPAGVSSISINIIGSGNQGYGGGVTNGKGGHGGIAATVTTVNNISVTPGLVIPYTVGARSSQSTNYGDSNNRGASNGSATTFGSSGTIGPYTSAGASYSANTYFTSSALGGDGASTGLTGDGASNAQQGDGSGGSGGAGYGSGGGGGHAGSYSGGRASDGIIIITYTAAVTPVASFTYTPSSGTAPLSVSFTDTSSNTPTSWSWDFGDGNTSTLQNPTHSFTTAGSSTVSLTASNAAGSSSPATHSVTVTSMVASFNSNPKGFYSGQTVKFYDTSTSTGEVITSWSWDFGDGNTSALQNPTHTYATSLSNTSYTVALTVTGSNSGTNTSTQTGFIYEVGTSTSANKVTTMDYYNQSVFLYNGSYMAIVNRVPDTNNHLAFTSLECEGTINRGGVATIEIVDSGNASTVEKTLLASEYSTPTNVAILVGYQVVWTGRILRSTQGNTALNSVSNPVKQWTVECESDINKMSTQNVTASGTLTASPGSLVKSICNNSVSGDIQWIDSYHSIIAFDGPSIQYLVTSKDMLTQFQSIAKVCGFDWRTHCLQRLLIQTAYSSNTVTVTTYRAAANSLVGWYCIFLGDATHYPSSYGYISANAATGSTTTSLTLSNVVGTPPSGGAWILLIGPPILDFAADISEKSVQAAYANNDVYSTSGYNCYEYDDKTDYKNLITKVVVNAKDITSNSSAGYTKTITATAAAKDAWTTDLSFFQHSTYITYKTEGYLYKYDSTVSTVNLYLIGQDYSFVASDTFYVYAKLSTGVPQVIGPLTVSSTSLVTQADGTPTTLVVVVTSPGTGQYMKYSVVVGTHTFIKDYSVIDTGTYHFVGNEVRVLRAGSTDTARGPYVSITSGDMGQLGTSIYPHYPGCLISTEQYSEVSPQEDSPIANYGLIQKTLSVDTQTTKSDLDAYATKYLLSNSYYYKRAAFWCHPVDFTVLICPPGDGSGSNAEYNQTFGFLKEGQRISVLPNINESIVQYQIADWVYNANAGKVQVTLGDFDRNVFTVLSDKTNSLTGSLT